mmetsp:Transcript_36974/g.93251  ORF Transcript_36974/g.93251 Transcript_36974/m.93251 type:complete len:394 (-) Transcript_36974:157-1338(-)|eukprot:CAMPEP_0202878658 /NCGR_PEP_ID=MMETSP1391-20130828/32525_1 /ASSEMBLY_ACC=CAM_ASM_000867 /TAXON_ID=1034604 /ORGANISM="Chlamydomonas leiostraca, Strain SAG 11-49" /LENGTH=393 /DNA_ID=CAMNT_0049560881 /DNA_START=29 /DNA_END=1210 /DNA_ORIENTATION=-
MDEWEVLEEGDEQGYIERGQAETSPGGASSSARSEGHSSGVSGAVHGRAITREMIIKALEKRGARVSTTHAQADAMMAQATHLHLNGMRLSRIDHLKGLPRLETLYLYDNQIEALEGLSALPSLTHLYLQDNHISHITGLGALTNLQKLYLAGNQIRCVSGLRGLLNLEELHISNQRLQPGEAMEFDGGSVAEVAPTLRVLSAINCALTDSSLPVLSQLGELRRLQLGENRLQSMDALEEVLRGMPRLMSLELQGNPLTRHPKYREQVVVMSDSLQSLDDEPILPQQRENLMRLQIKKMKAVLAAEKAAESGVPALQQPAQAPAGAMAQGVVRSPIHHVQRHLQPPTTAGFGAPRHLAKQVSGSQRNRAQPTIPGRGDAQDVSLGMQGMQLRQ